MTTATAVRPTLGVLPLADGRFAVASSDPTRPPYLVHAEGALLVCSCPAWTYSRSDPRTCKHADAVRAHLREQARHEERLCQTCRLCPVTDGLRVCRDCREKARRSGFVNSDKGACQDDYEWATMTGRYADDAEQAQGGGADPGVRMAREQLLPDDGEQARIAALNAKVLADWGWE
jgi:hypothetical protein